MIFLSIMRMSRLFIRIGHLMNYKFVMLTSPHELQFLNTDHLLSDKKLFKNSLVLTAKNKRIINFLVMGRR